MHFVNNQLLQTISHTEQEGVCVKAKSKKLNPKDCNDKLLKR